MSYSIVKRLKELSDLERKYNPTGKKPLKYLPKVQMSNFVRGAKGLTKIKLLEYMQHFTTDETILKNLRFSKLSKETTFYYYWILSKFNK